MGVIDVTPYRDDRAQTKLHGQLSLLKFQVAVDDKTVVLIDDVIFRGRTIRAAMEAVERLGQPKRILVAVLSIGAPASCRFAPILSAKMSTARKGKELMCC